MTGSRSLACSLIFYSLRAPGIVPGPLPCRSTNGNAATSAHELATCRRLPPSVQWGSGKPPPAWNNSQSELGRCKLLPEAGVQLHDLNASDRRGPLALNISSRLWAAFFAVTVVARLDALRFAMTARLRWDALEQCHPLTLHSCHGQSFPQRPDADHVENGPVSSRIIRLTLIATLVAAILLGAVIWLAAPVITGRTLNLWEACAVSAVILATFAWWRRRRLRRQREQIETLRDSALW